MTHVASNCVAITPRKAYPYLEICFVWPDSSQLEVAEASYSAARSVSVTGTELKVRF